MGGVIPESDTMRKKTLKIKTREVIKRVRKPLPGPTRIHRGKKVYNRKVTKRIIQEAHEDIRQGQDKRKG